ncbi:hypothetical protein MPEAHAMD_7169 [Methylobacterium frigidaeris]|uniref:Uncharacterized protein n=1 Tax=Methylobacterium frigidaeris TaxID=2038277 RepID=A0AA37M8K6_9HYPH|nr:hypothetical protein MPEAHAMD_7169 [Methylobacterium frigidaeris]
MPAKPATAEPHSVVAVDTSSLELDHMDIRGENLIGSSAIIGAERPVHGIEAATGVTLEPGFAGATWPI